MKPSSLALILLMAILSSCATTTQVIKPEKEPDAPVIEVDKTMTSCTTLEDIDPSLRSSTEDAFTLYRDQIRFKNYEDARVLWKTAYYTAPGANGKITYHFSDGIKIYDYLFENEVDGSKKQALVDTIMSIYDMRVQCFEDDGTILAHRAFDSYYKYSKYTDSEETFKLFKKVIEMKNLETDYFVINPFSKLLYDRVLEDKTNHAEGSQLALKILEIIEHGVANCKEKYCEAWNVINEYSPPLLSNLEGIKGFYPCEYFIEKYYPQYEANPDDCDNVSEVYYKLIWAECLKMDHRFIVVKNAKDSVCYVAPPPPGILRQARDCLEQGKFNCAIEKYEEYVRTNDDPEKKARFLYRISQIYYAHIKNFPAARKYALEAAANKADWGDPYMLIGKLYASSGPLCGPGTGWDSQVVTWAAIDKFTKAKQIDPSVTDQSNKWIGRYRQYMPKKEDIFFRSLKVGDTFRVPCWIQENTKIRTSD